MPQFRLPSVLDPQRPPSVGRKRVKRSSTATRETRFELSRARRPQPARDIPWRRLFGLGVSVMVVGAVLYGAAWLLLGDTLRVRQVNVVGSQVVDPYAVAAVAGLDGDSLLRMDLGAAEARVAQVPGVERVSITRNWPHGVQITLVEQQGWGYWQAGGKRVLVDANGHPLVLARPPAKDAPTIVDVAAPADLANGLDIDVDTVRLVDRLRNDGTLRRLGITPSAFVFRRDRGLTVVVDDAPDAVFGDSTNYAFKVATWEAVLGQLTEDELMVAEIDLRFGQNVVMR